MDDILIASMLASTLRVATPLMLCALAGLIAERSGVIDLSLEGKMLFAACIAASVGVWWGSMGLAIVAGMAVSVVLSWLHGFACVSHSGDQVVSGMAINIIAAGLTGVLATAWFAQGGQTPQLSDTVRLEALWPNAATSLKDVPLVGAILGIGLFSHNGMVYLSLALVPLVWWLLYRTRFGLRLRAVGENPAMVDAAGVSVPRMRYMALTLNGLLTGLAGCYLVLAQSALFMPNMTAGRGYMALAAMIFGKWRPVGAFWACLLFGFLDAVAIQLQGVPLPVVGEVPVQIVQALPYLLTVILLAGFIGNAIAPKALGRPYLKER